MMTTYEINIRRIKALLWDNFGKLTENIFRSGQMGWIRLPITVRFKNIKCIIALNMDGLTESEAFERKFCKEHKIEHICYNWAAGGNKFPEQLEIVLDTLERNEKNGIKTLVHCAGGKDRTGGAIGHWLLRFKHGNLADFVTQCAIHKVPGNGWIESVVSEVSTPTQS